MATQTSPMSQGHSRTGSSSSIPYVLPASPTLTNPDMILPDYDDRAIPDLAQSPLTMWTNNQFNFNGNSYNMAPITPTTPIIYGNGTMLSDIGEVTEAESNAGGRFKSSHTGRNGYTQSGVVTRQTANGPVYEALKKKKSEPRVMSRDRERRLSTESTSTVTGGDRPADFPEFDDSVSVDDSNFQGDDEDSVAESYVFDDGANDGERTPPAREFARGIGPEAEERYSTALSRRAEQILANAKRRLTTMEGNLHRARSSLSIDSGTSDSSTPLPFARPSAASYRNPDTGLSRGGFGHNRISSENNLPSDFKPATLSPRSSSALGVTGSYRQLLLSSRSVDYKRDSPQTDSFQGNTVYGNASFSKSKASLHDSKYTLEPLSEDETSRDALPSQPNLESAKLDTFLSPTFGSFDDHGLRRSASTAQMRDIKDHMEELKGRLSSLREQAREDRLKRRSMQSLRSNDNPFTHARESSSDSKTQFAGGKSMKDISRWNDGVESLYESDLDNTGDRGLRDLDTASIISGSVYSDQGHGAASPKSSWVPNDQVPAEAAVGVSPPEQAEEVNDDIDDMDDMKTEDGYNDDDDDDATDFQDVMSDSGESLYHDSVQNQVSHEDREDAFDYEHFFLHSAMGSMTQKKLRKRGSRGSFSSEDSVETTRGPAANNEYRRSRRSSNGSLSSIDSFLTATEGRTTRAESRATRAESRINRAENDNLEHFPEQVLFLPEKTQMHTPDTAKRMTFDLGMPSPRPEEGSMRASMILRPQSSAATFPHRPSVSSLGSTGTNRSFPLVNRPKPTGMPTPRASPDQGLQKISESLMSETASVCESVHGEKPIEMLQKEDQILVGRLVASLGKCVLGLTEHGRASTESRAVRRRIEAARLMLDGHDGPI